MRLRYAVRTDVGMKRMHNEDRFAVFEEEQVFLVADGMGGHAAGDLASKLAADAIGEFYRRSQVDGHTPWPFELQPSLSFAENRLACAIKLANNRIFEAAKAQFGRKGMGTTVVAAAVDDEQICIGHVGDSRAYRIRDGAIVQLTRDHSLLEDYKDTHPNMTAAEVASFPYKNVIMRALGHREIVDASVHTHPLRAGDLYLLCTDGLSGMLAEHEILRIANGPATLERAVAELVESANRHGGDDNVTVLLLQCLAS